LISAWSAAAVLEDLPTLLLEYLKDLIFYIEVIVSHTHSYVLFGGTMKWFCGHYITEYAFVDISCPNDLVSNVDAFSLYWNYPYKHTTIMHEICCTFHSSQTNLYNEIVLLLYTSLLFMFVHWSWFKQFFFIFSHLGNDYIISNEGHYTIDLDDNLDLEQEDLTKYFSIFMGIIYVFNLAYPKQCIKIMMFV